MGFLAPLWLTLASIAAVPLLLHLLRRRTGSRVDFPAARYLLRAEREHSRKLRLRNILLMLLRVAAVLLVALAAARPVTRLAGTGHAPTALAIVLDNSLSTAVVVDGRPLLDALRARALAAVEQATGEDRLWLVTADGAVAGGGHAAVAEAVRRVSPLAGAGDLGGAARRALALVAGAGLAERRVVVVTDGQASAWSEALRLDGAEIVAYAPSRAAPANRAVLAAEPRPERWTPRGTLAARVRTTDSATYRVTLRGDGVERTLARGTVAADSLGGVADIAVHAAPTERGWVAGQVELPPDELRADDSRPFALWVGAAPRTAVGAGAGPFVRSALETIAEGPLAASGASGASVVSVVSADELERLPALVVAPADPVRMGAANRALERAGVPLRFGPPKRAESTLRGGRLDGIAVRLRYPLESRSPAPVDTLVTAGGEPWVVAGERWVVVASPLVPAATDLPVRAAFVPWLSDLLVQRLAGEPGRILAAAPGDTLPRPAWADAIETGEAAPPALGAGPLVAPARPGVFFLRAEGRRAGALVVAAEPEESDLARLDADDLAGRLGGRGTRVLVAPEGFDAAVFGGGGRRELAVPFLVGALLLLALESLLVRGRAAAPAPQAA